MTTVQRPVPTTSPPQAVTLAPDSLAPEQILDVTVRSVPPGPLVLSVRGEIDLHTSPLLRDRLLAQLPRATRLLVIDLTEVDFLGATGLTVLLAVRTRAQAVGTHLRVVAGTTLLRRVLNAAGLLDALDAQPDLAHALSRTGGHPHFA
ncbi:STAS domain-containing protein [Crossiella sp. CA-258035]|uniref:STAS domain-containing protein n=1 Tax=Crossiella sp. CA-258035 TaxID=2981138 RepID=UPI0024BC27D3|nr:STAS domain-containing protein [Crossiella sp. CA-258035]WHT16151.1 STAS domain-containing protein [Crossiella sp. CA-258035]